LLPKEAKLSEVYYIVENLSNLMPMQAVDLTFTPDKGINEVWNISQLANQC
jgi:hypothetical protein